MTLTTGGDHCNRWKVLDGEKRNFLRKRESTSHWRAAQSIFIILQVAFYMQKIIEAGVEGGAGPDSNRCE